MKLLILSCLAVVCLLLPTGGNARSLSPIHHEFSKRALQSQLSERSASEESAELTSAEIEKLVEDMLKPAFKELAIYMASKEELADPAFRKEWGITDEDLVGAENINDVLEEMRKKRSNLLKTYKRSVMSKRDSEESAELTSAEIEKLVEDMLKPAFKELAIYMASKEELADPAFRKEWGITDEDLVGAENINDVLEDMKKKRSHLEHIFKRSVMSKRDSEESAELTSAEIEKLVEDMLKPAFKELAIYMASKEELADPAFRKEWGITDEDLVGAENINDVLEEIKKKRSYLENIFKRSVMSKRDSEESAELTSAEVEKMVEEVLKPAFKELMMFLASREELADPAFREEWGITDEDLVGAENINDIFDDLSKNFSEED